MTTSDLLCGLIALVVILIAWAIYRQSFGIGYWFDQHEPIHLDPSNPADVFEARCIEHQRTTGRELAGEIRWKDED